MEEGEQREPVADRTKGERILEELEDLLLKSVNNRERKAFKITKNRYCALELVFFIFSAQWKGRSNESPPASCQRVVFRSLYSVPDQIWAPSCLSYPNRLDSPLPRQLGTSHPCVCVCVCPYIRMVHSRLVQMQPEVGLAGPNALVLGACGVLVVPCLPTGAVHVSVVPRWCRCSSGSRRGG